MRCIEQVLAELQRSRFRRRFRLGEKEQACLTQHGLAGVLAHGRDFIAHRLAPAQPPNDGRQTPMRGHPVFIAQHATATCCRSCLAKWHHIRARQPLTPEQQSYVLAVLEAWLHRQPAAPARHTPPDAPLFRQDG